MLTIFVLQHVHELRDGEEDVKFIGVYSTRRRARAAIARLGKQQGFRDLPSGFHISEYKVDHDRWTEGYVTINPGSKKASRARRAR